MSEVTHIRDRHKKMKSPHENHKMTQELEDKYDQCRVEMLHYDYDGDNMITITTPEHSRLQNALAKVPSTPACDTSRSVYVDVSGNMCAGTLLHHKPYIYAQCYTDFLKYVFWDPWNCKYRTNTSPRPNESRNWMPVAVLYRKPKREKQ